MPELERGGAVIWWQTEGYGPPVLLVSGLSSPCDLLYRLAGGLAASHEVLRLDNRGVGRTGVPAGPYPVAVMAEDAAAVVSAAGHASAHVVGLSMGGLIAQELVLTRPDLVRSLVLASTHTGMRSAVPGDPEVAQLLAAGAGMGQQEFHRATVPFTYAAGTSPERIDEDLARRAANPTSPEGYANQLQGCIGWDRSADLAQIEVPTLVVHGAEDRLVPPANAFNLAAAIPGARVEVLDGASHHLFTDQEAQVITLLVGFFAEVERAAEQPA